MLFTQKRTLFISTLFCFATGSLWADKVVLKNGDQVTGSIVKQDGKTITIKTDSFGVVSTAWDQVASVVADKPLTVVLADGKTVQGTLATAGDKLEVVTKDTKLSLAPAQVATLRDDAEQKAYERLLRPGWTQLWTGLGSLGFAGTGGNSKSSTFTTALTAARVTRTDKTSLYFNAIKASATANGKSSGTAQAIRGGFGYDHTIKSRLFVNTFNDYEYDLFQNLDLRFVAGGGLGYQAIKSARRNLSFVGGGDFNRSSYNTPKVTKAAEAYFGNDYSYKLNVNSSLNQSFRMFNNLTDSGTYRVNFDVGVSTKISRWLTWNVSLSDRYLNHPAFGRKTNDYLYTTGLGIAFAR